MEEQNELIANLEKFMHEEKMNLKLIKSSDSEIWFDSPDKAITMKIVINHQKHEILYDVYSVEDEVHLSEKTIKEVEGNEHSLENERRWKTAETLENIWLILDEVEIWAKKHTYALTQTNPHLNIL